MASSLKVPALLIAVYGLIALIGGTIGFVKAGSLASLLAGGGSGLVLLLAAGIVAKKPDSARVGLILALVVSVLLIGRFASTLRGGASPVALVMITGGLVALVAAALGLSRARRA